MILSPGLQCKCKCSSKVNWIGRTLPHQIRAPCCPPSRGQPWQKKIPYKRLRQFSYTNKLKVTYHFWPFKIGPLIKSFPLVYSHHESNLSPLGASCCRQSCRSGPRSLSLRNTFLKGAMDYNTLRYIHNTNIDDNSVLLINQCRNQSIQTVNNIGNPWCIQLFQPQSNRSPDNFKATPGTFKGDRLERKRPKWPQSHLNLCQAKRSLFVLSNLFLNRFPLP